MISVKILASIVGQCIDINFLKFCCLTSFIWRIHHTPSWGKPLYIRSCGGEKKLYIQIASILWIQSIFNGPLSKRNSLVIPCWTLAQRISYRPFCTASAVCCMLLIGVIRILNIFRLPIFLWYLPTKFCQSGMQAGLIPGFSRHLIGVFNLSKAKSWSKVARWPNLGWAMIRITSNRNVCDSSRVVQSCSPKTTWIFL